MKITAIEKQKKGKRYNIFLDGEFAFGIYDDTLGKYGLRTNDELDEKRIKEIKKYDEISFGKRVAYTFLSHQPRTEKEIRDKLKLKKISEKSINEIINKLKELKFINDEDYAKQYLESRLERNPQGKRVLEIKLIKKGIDRNLIKDIIEEKYNPQTETEKALEVLKKYKKKVKSKDKYDLKRKCFAHLLSRGFEYDVINEALSLNEEL
jgi:regulatory protein